MNKLSHGKAKTLSIRRKTSVAMVSIAVGVALLVGVMSASLYGAQYVRLDSERTNETSVITANLLKNDIENINRSTVLFLSNDIVYDVFTKIEKGSLNDEFYDDYTKLQPLFDNLITSQPLVENMLLLCENGEIYSTYTTGLNFSLQDFEEEFKQKTTVWLPSKNVGSRIATNKVIPVVVPVEYNTSISFSHSEQPHMVLVLFISVENLNNSMEQMNRSAFSESYIVNSDGVPLNLEEDSRLDDVFLDEAFKTRLEKYKKQDSYVANVNGDIYNVTLEKVGANGLFLVNVASYDEMLNDVLSILFFTMASVFIGSIIAIIISAKLSHSLTKPISKLVKTVGEIKKGEFNVSEINTDTTELSALDEAVREMSSTIERQIIEIRNEESQRRKAEMDALTEQINPHFLYNTLECCHWEVLNDNKESAADMIESLGTFLRLSLNKGNDKITLEQAVEHAKEYVNIMNCRMGIKIDFESLLESEIENFLLPKMILQPLVENCILHGFKIQENTGNVCVLPKIKILANIIEDKIIISIQDNGAGIDIENAQSCIDNDVKNEGHVGISNVYKRLQYSFGADVKFEFTSMPFYKNIVKIILPFS